MTLSQTSLNPGISFPEASSSHPVTQHLNLIRRHFDSIAGDYLDYKKLNSYYHRYLTTWCKSIIPPGRKNLDLGCGRGDILSALESSQGLGIDLSPKMIELASRDRVGIEFKETAIEHFQPTSTYDNALLINVLEYTYDPCLLLNLTNRALSDNGRVLIATANPLWSTIFKITSRLKMRIPDCKRLFLTNPDIHNLLALNGFEVVHETRALILPKFIPLMSPVLNWFASRVPFIRTLCSTQLIVGRKIPPVRRELSVSIIIPCYNEEKNIPNCIQNVPKLGSRTEVIFVDDGSSDRTSDAVRAEKRSDIEVRLIQYAPNRGKGNAVMTGFKAATGDVLMILDADLTTPPEDLTAVYNALADGRTEFVNCTRMIYPMDDRAMKVANFIGNKIFTGLVSWIIERRVTDTLCGTKAFFRKDFPFFKTGRDPWGDYDFIFGAAQLRLSMCEVPVHYRERVEGVSKMKSFSHGMKLLRLCFSGFFQIKFMKILRKENG